MCLVLKSSPPNINSDCRDGSCLWGWLLPEILGPMKPEDYWAWQIKVLPLCFPTGPLRAMVFCCFLNAVRLYIETYQELAWRNCEVGEGFFPPHFHLHCLLWYRLLRKALWGLPGFLNFLKSCDNMEGLPVSFARRVGSSSASLSFVTLDGLCKLPKPQFPHQ